jgi:hypothetical protein
VYKRGKKAEAVLALLAIALFKKADIMKREKR